MRKTFAMAMPLLIWAVFGAAQSPKQVSKESAQMGPCDLETTQLQLNECYGEQFRKADAHRNTVYASALKQLQGYRPTARQRNDAELQKHDETAVQKLEASEKVWFRYRDLHCEAARFEFEGGSMSPMIWAQCMAVTTQHRIEEIKAAYETGERKLE